MNWIFYIFGFYFFIGFLWFFLELALLKRELASPVPKGLSHRLTKRFQSEKTSSLYLKFSYAIIVVRCMIWPFMFMCDIFGKDMK